MDTSNTMLQDLQLLFPFEGWLATLDGMLLHSTHRTKGLLAGKRRSSSLGSSLEFADYRAYIPGDDIRRMDWNLYGRTSKAYIRQYWDEQERSFQVYVDSSRSMTAFHDGEQNKWLFALRAAASIGYLALQGEDRMAISLYNEREVTHQLPMLYGKGAKFTMIGKLGEWIKAQQFGNKVTLADSFKDASSDAWLPFQQRGKLPRRAGVTWIFSDGLYENGLEQLFIQLQARNQQLVFVHILHQDELAPQIDGEWRLIDIETGTAKDVAMSPSILQRYHQGVLHFQEQVRLMCESRGITYYLMDCSKPLPSEFMSMLASGGQLQYR